MASAQIGKLQIDSIPVLRFQHMSERSEFNNLFQNKIRSKVEFLALTPERKTVVNIFDCAK